ncbi:ESPR-type extended signal peptide-containing protein [Burkholderia sp. BE12]|uniref:ESPR-type extended signal peptide-containing protein n=1 Tax=Burkholderia sp. BE12 TaxID=2082394 RepID=UPI000CF4A987|nr:ESPR-type extended signal peptide-containing protein [Burkholderia sp. BE12]
MNKTHRTIFNTVTGTWVAASEFAKGRKKSGGQRALVRSAIALAAMLLGLGASQAFADTTDAGTCTTVDGRNGTLGETGACNASSIGSIGTMAALDDTYVKVSGTTAAIGSGENSLAIGNSAQALTKDATAVGSGTLATGTSSAAFGAFASASGTSSAAFGASASATGTSSSAFGSFSTASGLGSVATGRYANANGDYTTALGNSALAGTTYATAVGTSATASGISASAFGSSATASGSGAVAVGRLATASGTGALALGNAVSATGNYTTVVGNTAKASVAGAVALGYNANASVSNAVAIGTNSVADKADTISVGSAAVKRKIVNVAAGDVSASSTDVVNGSQLYATHQQIAQNTADITTINSKLGSAITDDYVKINTVAAPAKAAAGSIAIGGAAEATSTYAIAIGHSATVSGTNTIALGVGATASGESSTALGKGTIATGLRSSAVGVSATAFGHESVALGANSVADRDRTVSVGSSAWQRQITNMAAGTEANDAVNVSQLSPVVEALGGGSSIDPVTGAVTGPTYNLANGGTQTTVGEALDGLDHALTTANGNLAKNTSDIADLGSNVTRLGSDMTDLGAQVTGIDGRVTVNEGDIKALADQIGSGTTGLVQQAGAGADLTVGANTDGAAVNFAGTAGERKLTGLANGDVAAGSTDAVTGDQLHATNQDIAKNTSDIAELGSSVTQLGGDVSNLNTQLTNIDGRVTQNQTHIAKNTTDITTINDQLADLSSGTIGLVQQTAAGADLTVGVNTDGAAVNFAGTAGERKLTGLANGDVAAGSTDAVTGDQLHTVGVNVSNLDQRVTNNETSITQIRSDMNSGSIGLVQQSAVGADLMVGANTDGAAVNFAGTAGERKLTGIANGDVEAGSMDAVTGDQLYATNQAVAQNASGISDNRTEITNINSQLASGQIGLVRQDQTTGAITVAASTGGTSVNFAGTSGARTLSGVANGVQDDDAVTIAQLKATGLIDYTGKELGAVVYDGIDLDSVTFGGSNGTVLHNVGAGLIASGSMDAVNGGQLFAMQQEFENRFSGLGDRVSDLEAGGGSGGPGGPGNGSGGFDPSGSGEGSVQLGSEADAAGSNSTAIGNGASASAGGGTAIGQGSLASGNNGTAIGHGSNASGDGSTALGQGSNSSGSGSTAVGQNANASGSNSVALGAGSTADRDNAVSVGSAGAERQITNVAAGTAPTDAVNVQQMNNTARSARQDAMGGVAAAMAVAGLPQSTLPGRTFVAMAGSTYGGEYGSALGVSYMTRDGKWTIKASANTSSRGEVGAVVGGGFYW